MPEPRLSDPANEEGLGAQTPTRTSMSTLLFSALQHEPHEPMSVDLRSETPSVGYFLLRRCTLSVLSGAAEH